MAAVAPSNPGCGRVERVSNAAAADDCVILADGGQLLPSCATDCTSLACNNGAVATEPKRIVLSEAGIAGSYELVEQRVDGSLLLRPTPERLSDVLDETEGQIFHDEEFAAHLQRVAATEDDLPADLPA